MIGAFHSLVGVTILAVCGSLNLQGGQIVTTPFLGVTLITRTETLTAIHEASKSMI